jgi:iron(III) transport system substrate-binding protein
MKKIFSLIVAGALISSAALLTAQTPVQAQTNELTVYTGRGKGLVDPLVQAFQSETGIKVNVRYGTDAQMLAALQEEGAKSPADLFWANTSGTLGLLNKSNLLTTLPNTVINKPTSFVPASKKWVPLSIRFRVLAYNPSKFKPTDLPASVLDLPKLSSLKGRVGWTPGYASFQDFVGAIAAVHGEAKAKEWLTGMKGLEPKAYGTNNTQMLEALRAGEIDVALTNHYYVLRFTKVGYQIGTHYFQNGDVGSLALVTGAGVLKSSKKNVNSSKLINWLLSPKAQQFFSGEIFEYPVIKGAILPSSLLPLADTLERSPKIDFEKLADYVDNAQKLLREAGLL